MPSLDATAPLHKLPCVRRAGFAPAAISVCADCAWNCDDAGLEQKIHAKVSETAPAAVAAETRAHTGLRPVAA
jgi:hypothetical protein